MDQDQFEAQAWVRDGVAAAMAREFERDARGFLVQFAEQVEQAFPESAVVDRRGLFKKTIVRVTFDLGGTRLSIEDPGQGPLRGKRGQVVRGITLKTEDVPVGELLEEVGRALQSRADENEESRNALRRWLSSR